MINRKIVILLVLLQFCVAGFASSYKTYRWTPVDEKFDSVASILESCIFYDYPRENYSTQVKILERLAESSPVPIIKSRAAFWSAWLCARTNPELAFKHMKKASEYCNTAKYPYDNARLRYLHGDILRLKGEWVESYMIHKENEKYFEDCNDLFWQAKSGVMIGLILQNLGDNKGALSYFKEADSLFYKIRCTNCYIKNRINICNNLYMVGEKKQALKELYELEKEDVVKQDSLYMANVLVSIVSVSEHNDGEASHKAYNLVKKMRYENFYALAEESLASYLKAHERNDSALYYYRMAWKSAQCYNDVYTKPKILKGLSDTFYKLGNSDSAYFYMNLANIYQDSLINHNKVMSMSRLENRAMFEQYEAEKRMIEERSEYHRNIAYMIIVALVLILCMVVCILWLSRRKAQVKEQLNDARNRELILQNKQHLMEIESKNRELSSNTIIIAEKNAKLKELYEKIEQTAVDEKVGGELKSDIKSELINDDWTYFNIKFEKIYPHFFANLKKRYPALSETELRLCAYIRIGMSAKEIAKILSVQPESVNTSRYRMRKKMQLVSGDSLETILRSF